MQGVRQGLDNLSEIEMQGVVHLKNLEICKKSDVLATAAELEKYEKLLKNNLVNINKYIELTSTK